MLYVLVPVVALSCFLNKGPHISYCTKFRLIYVASPSCYCYHMLQIWKLNSVWLPCVTLGKLFELLESRLFTTSFHSCFGKDVVLYIYLLRIHVYIYLI